MTISRHIIRPRHSWTEQELALLRQRYADTPSGELATMLGLPIHIIYRAASNMGLKKSAAFLASAASGRTGLGRHPNSVKSRFQKGSVPVNKGVRMPGWAPGRMSQTQFAKGQDPHNTMPLWSFRWCDGYLMLKTGKPAPKPIGGWEYLHKLIWEHVHGPLPDWRIARIWWKDHDHGNCSLDNLELVTAQEHMRRTTIHNLPPELKDTIQLMGRLTRRIRRNEREHQKQTERPAQSSVRDHRIA